VLVVCRALALDAAVNFNSLQQARQTISDRNVAVEKGARGENVTQLHPSRLLDMRLADALVCVILLLVFVINRNIRSVFERSQNLVIPATTCALSSSVEVGLPTSSNDHNKN